MNKNMSAVITTVVKNDLCVGCGACVDICSNNALKMEWNENGLLIPTQINICNYTKKCISVCPFNPENRETIDEIFDRYDNNNDTKKYKNYIGNFISLYVGHSNKYRLSSSSGGISTWFVDQLFQNDLIDYSIGVGTSNSNKSHFDYQIVSKTDNILSISKTKYYPVTLVNIFNFIRENKGRYVISGLPCFLKAVRLFQDVDPIVKERIKFTIGITCGGMKSRFFTEYLAWKLKIKPGEIEKPEYRNKNTALSAGDYSFSFKKGKERVSMGIRDIGHNWGLGLFKPNSCDFCDDIFAELADISIGDAWLQPYQKDGKGANLIIVRSPIVDTLINQGKKNKDIIVSDETADRIISSQKANIRHRRKGLQFRLFWSSLKGIEILGKRVSKKK